MNKVKLPDAQYVITTSSINAIFGGLTAAMLQRSRLFSKYADQETLILNFNYNHEYPEIIASLKQKDKINDDIKIINMYEYFKKDTVGIPSILHQINEPGLETVKAEQENTYRYFKNGLYIKYKRFDEKNLVLVDYFNKSRSRTQRDEYASDGTIHRTTYMDLQFNLPKQELYFRKDGKCYLNKFLKINPDTKKVSVEKIFLFLEDTTLTFKNNMELQHYFMDQIIGNTTTYLIGEERGTDPIVMSYKNEHCYKVFLTHNIHIRKPYHYSSVIKLGNRPVMEHMSIPDAVVYLTNKQKKDIVDRFGDRTNYFVIPHAIKKPNECPKFENRDLDRVVMLARYHEQKQLDHAIKAFKYVAEKLPQKKLEIYGFGDLEKSLKKLIKELDLENNVFLKGFTSNPTELLQTSALSILSSEYEGFGLVVLESLANACPVISYDLKYGPSDMIEHGSNGYLVENLNIEEFGQAIIKALEDKQLLKILSENAYQSVDKFNEETFIANWQHLFIQVAKQKTHRHNVTNMEILLQQLNWTSSNVLKVAGTLTLEGKISKNYRDNYKIAGKLYNRETKEFITIPCSFDLKNSNLFHFDLGLDFSSFDFNESVLDLSILIEWENISFEKRIGYKKEDELEATKQTQTSKSLLVEPYYTKDYGNLSFKITKENNTNQKKTIIQSILRKN